MHCMHYHMAKWMHPLRHLVFQNKRGNNPAVKNETLPKQLLRLKAKTSWSWERMCREFHRVMGHEEPTHTTLFRYASGNVKRPNVIAARYVRQAIDKLTAELSQQNRQA